MGVAVNVTELPIQKGFEDGDMDILTGSKGFTIIERGILVAGLPEVQVSEDVRTQVTISLFKGLSLYDGLFVPTLIPLTFHW